MSEQEQHDTNNTAPHTPDDDQRHAAQSTQASPASSNAPDAAQNDVKGLVLDGSFDDVPTSTKPSNGLEYGAMDNQYPSTYDPYIFGHPDADDALGEAAARAEAERGQTRSQHNANNARNTQQGAPYQTRNQPGQPNGMPYQPYGYGQQGQPNQQSSQQPNGQQQFNFNDPNLINNLNAMNPDDPAQNPLYGHWDPGAIIAFVFALIFPLPVLPAIFGWLSMRRTKVYHMKGYGLAVAAVVINVLFTIAWLYLLISGVSPNEYLNQMLDSMNLGNSGGDSVSA